MRLFFHPNAALTLQNSFKVCIRIQAFPRTVAARELKRQVANARATDLLQAKEKIQKIAVHLRTIEVSIVSCLTEGYDTFFSTFKHYKHAFVGCFFIRGFSFTHSAHDFCQKK